MKIFKPNKPTGSSPFYTFCIAVWEIIFNGQFPFQNSDSVKWSWTGGFWRAEAALPANAAPTNDWANPIVYDKTKSYKKGQFVVIRPTDTIVTAGAIDANTNTIKKSYGGVWKATRDVNVVQSGDSETYHVPYWPTPTANDPDAPNVYWWLMALYITTTPDCNGGATYVVNAQVQH